MTSAELAESIDAALPQTQCTRCGYADCRAYADAIASGEAAINQCPPGGAEGMVRLAAITRRPTAPLNPDNGREGPRLLAVIDEAWCIGCTLCLDACPVDSIVGASKQMHTVIDSLCTGCELCIPVCPVDCIALLPVTASTGWAAWSAAQACEARERYAAHTARLNLRRELAEARLASHSVPVPSGAALDVATGAAAVAENGAENGAATHAAADAAPIVDPKRAAVAMALARARGRAASRTSPSPSTVTPIDPSPTAADAPGE